MSSKQKKVILRPFAGNVLHGYLPASGFVQSDHINYLNLQGRLASIPLLEVKSICYVRDFNLSDPVNPERLLRRSFLARPRGDGLWIRITFKDDADTLEGLADADTSLLDGLTCDAGVYFSPPDTRTNTQRVYVPRSAIATFQILSVISSPSKRMIPSPRRDESEERPMPVQDPLFEGAPSLPAKRGKHGTSSK